MIQIHPMFLFIFDTYKGQDVLILFKYIPCSCLSRRIHKLKIQGTTIQIHPMFLFISYPHNAFPASATIQIHPMFLFICMRISPSRRQTYSNTSHVPVYPNFKKPLFRRVVNSNTSHVPVYQTSRKSYRNHPGFKYIPCSCLSCGCVTASIFTGIQIHPMFLFISIRICGARRGKLFKYIPCSCLSSAFKPLHVFIIRKFPSYYRIFSLFYQAFFFFAILLTLPYKPPCLRYNSRFPIL